MTSLADRENPCADSCSATARRAGGEPRVEGEGEVNNIGLGPPYRPELGFSVRY